MKKLQFNIQKISDDPPEVDLDEIARFTQAGGNGNYEIIVKKAVKNKSQKQLGAIFGLLIKDAICQSNDIGLDTSAFLKELVKADLPSGIGLTTELVKDILYCLCPMYRDGKRITLSKASTIEAAKFFDDARNLFAAHGIYIDEPNVNWREKG